MARQERLRSPSCGQRSRSARTPCSPPRSAAGGTCPRTALPVVVLAVFVVVLTVTRRGSRCRELRTATDRRTGALQPGKDDAGSVFIDFEPEIFMPLVHYLRMRRIEGPLDRAVPPSLGDAELEARFHRMLRFYGLEEHRAFAPRCSVD